MVGHETIDLILPHIKKNGVLATVVSPPASAAGRNLRVAPIRAQPDPARLEMPARDEAQGAFTIPIAKRLRLSQIREAQRLAEDGGIGKIILTP